MQENKIQENSPSGVLEFVSNTKKDEKEIAQTLVDIRAKFSK